MAIEFCLDTSFFINAWQKHYRIAVFPSVWSRVSDLIEEGLVYSVREVYEELKKQNDDLLEWAKARRSAFREPNRTVTKKMTALMLNFPNFAASGGSKNGADPWVIAQAQARNAILVTDENWCETKNTKPPKIPNVCEELGIKYLSPAEFLEEIGVCL